MPFALPTSRRRLPVCASLLAATWTGYALHAVIWPGTATGVTNWIYNGLLAVAALLCLLGAARQRDRRLAWIVMGLGLLAWTAGEVYSTIASSAGAEIPVPSFADLGYLTLYPASCFAIAKLLRATLPSFPRALWLDGAIVGSAVASVAAAVAFDKALAAGTAGGSLAVATNLAYPIGDLVLLTLVVAAFAFTGWRPGISWSLLGVGLTILAVTDGTYLLQATHDTYAEGGIVDTGWPLAALLVAAAAWVPRQPARPARLSGFRIAAVPTGAAVVATAVQGYDHFARLSNLVAALSIVTLVTVVVRMALSFRANQALLEGARDDALTDALTGLGNRRRLMADLVPLTAMAPRTGEVGLLVLLDLDGFKSYNDSYGHPAGDALLSRLGARMAAAAADEAQAYRLGGDEFCLLSRCAPTRVAELVDAIEQALSEHGEGFAVTASSGSVLIPAEAASSSAALQLADHRMYANKGRRRASAGTQSRDVLITAIRERQPELHAHITDVAELAVLVATELGMDAEARDEVARAAELHDTGKVAIPDAILNKPGPLEPDEWEFMRTHTLIGERILAAAPALAPVARLVRSSHERWDGGGYPDGLAGRAIPLGARVVSVCDAYEAMVADRPYRSARTPEQALAELDACAGAQFDASVVAAFTRAMARARSPLGA